MNWRRYFQTPWIRRRKYSTFEIWEWMFRKRRKSKKKRNERKKSRKKVKIIKLFNTLQILNYFGVSEKMCKCSFQRNSFDAKLPMRLRQILWKFVSSSTPFPLTIPICFRSCLYAPRFFFSSVLFLLLDEVIRNNRSLWFSHCKHDFYFIQNIC